MRAPSYVHGAGAVPLLGESIGENLRRTVEKAGEREALVVRHQGYRATYRELWNETGRAFPMTVTGKIQKFRMREISVRELGLERAARTETA